MLVVFDREKVLTLLKKLPKGEYSDEYRIYELVAPKRDFRLNFLGEKELNSDGWHNQIAFAIKLREMQYGLEYATGGKIHYTGTNDLNTYTVN